MALSKAAINRLIKENERRKCKPGEDCVKIVAIADLPTKFGKFQAVSFFNNIDGKDHAAFLHGNVVGKSGVPVRLQSECLTGDVMESLRCDCRPQLESALKLIVKMKRGMLLYLRQEGRGIGFVNKIKAYQLQDKGYDTYEANEMLGFKPDERDYDVAAHMLECLKVKSIRLMTNNPDKLLDLKHHGIRIMGRIPLITPPNRYNKFYLQTKETRMGQLLGLEQ